MKYLSLILFTFIVNLIFGQSIVTDRPDQTESSSTVGYGNLQIESGMSLTFDDIQGSQQRHLALPSNLFRYGITDGIELRLVSQFDEIKFENKKIQGISDLELGAKIELIKNKFHNTEIAFLSHLILPTGNKGISNDDYGVINKVALSHDLRENIALGYNLGYNYFGYGNGDFTYSLALGVAVNDEVGFYLEPYGDFEEFEEWINSFNAGITYLLRDNLQIDFSFGTGVNHRMNYIATGISWQIFK